MDDPTPLSEAEGSVLETEPGYLAPCSSESRLLNYQVLFDGICCDGSSYLCCCLFNSFPPL